MMSATVEDAFLERRPLVGTYKYNTYAQTAKIKQQSINPPPRPPPPPPPPHRDIYTCSPKDQHFTEKKKKKNWSCSLG